MKVLVLLFLVGTVMATQAADNKSMLEKNREDYQQQLARIDADAEAALKQWPAQYLQSLSVLEDKLQAAGDLDAVLAIRKAKDRFAAKKQVSKDAIVEIPQELHDLQVKALNAPDDVEVDRNKQILALAAKYVKTLETLKQSLTQVGQIDQAIVVDGEIDSMKIHPEVVAARLALFMADSVANDEAEGRTLPPGLKKGLILYYSFDKNEGGIVTDQSGQGHAGTVSGATWVTNGIKGGAYSFDGVNSYVDTGIPSLANGFSEVTLSVWACPFVNTPNSGIVCSPNTSGRPSSILSIGESAAGRKQVRFDVGDGTMYANAVTPGGCMEPGVGHIVTGTWKSLKSGGDGIVRIYVDGEFKSASPVPVVGLLSQGSSLKIGWDNAVTASRENRHFNGLIDEVMVYNRALSATEVKQLYSCR